jgi:glyceraldehyde 3-phosphate dehydrogenase
MINIGINGYGRIGRVIHRIADLHSNLNVVAINEVNPDINNIAYLANYDSTYGRRELFLNVNNNTLICDNICISVSHETNISKVPWGDLGVNIVIDSSGILENLKSSLLLKGQVDNVIVTNSPSDELVDKTVIYGVNEHEIDKKNDFLVSSSICDAIAFAPLAKLIDKEFQIEQGFLTTLHPWLGYQNLLDGPSKSYAQPGKIYDDYVLGRSSTMTLIPKNTSAISATCKVLPQLKNKFLAMSYRVPTSIVSSADATLKVRKKVTLDNLVELLLESERQNPKIIHNNHDALVSTDFIKTDLSVVVDHRFLKVENGFIKMLSWYDNEWGYSSRVIDLLNYISK